MWEYPVQNGTFVVWGFMTVQLEIMNFKKVGESVHLAVTLSAPVDVEVTKEDSVVWAGKLRGEEIHAFLDEGVVLTWWMVYYI